MAWNEPGPGRDPWNQGPKDNKGPPDLEEMLKRLKQRFTGNKTPGGSGKGGLPLPSGLVGLLFVALGLIWIASGIYVVDEQERAVELRFGSKVGTTGPGMHMHLPWPIEREEIVNVTGVRSVTDRAVMLTKDENIVDVELSVQYTVSSAEDYLFNVDDPDMTLRQATKAAVREVVGQSAMDFILTDGRDEVASRTKQLLQQRLSEYKTGLSVTEVNLQQAQPPELVQAAFADAIKAREDQQRLKNEAEAYANDRLPRARGAAARQMAEATAYRDQVIAKAQGDASRFSQLVAEYRKAPKVTRERLYLDSMNSVLTNSSKVLIDVSKSGSMIYLPLDQIMKNQPSMPDAQNNSVPNTASVMPSAQPDSGASPMLPNNDAPRARDRGRE
ncbi:FtsH protease activity modulator HflK [Stenotrophobium rhamnosiphilum]|uniref:Protein HflK n=1 Tax=Stenotrophobium rhamnosiphilum TaxID=2029166 RepID=A0A2T5MER7_9GAMM|nr:FtsH protease activity modulator HflK [Stenotrophobium rhamnosiphilum]PTU31057.1 FtsH protease activity modulator HflK [Stenotrophobium rhamnosiphilum]